MRSPVAGTVFDAIMSRLQQCHFNWYPVVPTQAAPVCDKLRIPAGAFILQVRPHYSAPSSATLSESSRADSVQARCYLLTIHFH